METANNDFKELGVRIGNRRRKLGLRQAEVNEMIGLSDKYMSHLESGRAIPSLDALMKLCAVLHTTPDALLLGSVRSDNEDDYLREKVKLITGKKKTELLCQFIDWLAEQDM